MTGTLSLRGMVSRMTFGLLVQKVRGRGRRRW
jgi:hypothetical protein